MKTELRLKWQVLRRKQFYNSWEILASFDSKRDALLYKAKTESMNGGVDLALRSELTSKRISDEEDLCYDIR